MKMDDLYRGYQFAANRNWDALNQVIEARMNRSIQDLVDEGLTVYLAGLLASGTMDANFLEEEKMGKMVDRLVCGAMEPIHALCYDESSSHHTSTLGLFYGSLRNINLFLKRDDIRKKIREMRAFVFQHLISGVTLASDTRKKEIRFDTLLACVPFGLFEPEDLVLVAAVNVLAQKIEQDTVSDEERLLLSWYYVEQGNFQKARDLLFASSENELLHPLVSLKLETLGQLETRLLLHRPAGNGNRYEPCFEERSPLQPMEGEKIVIQATAVPLDKEDPVVLNWNGKVIAGTLVDGGWQFEVSPQVANQIGDYYLFFEKHPEVKTKVFHVQIGEKRGLKNLEAITFDGVDMAYEGDGIRFIANLGIDGLAWSIEKADIIESKTKCLPRDWKDIFEKYTFEVTSSPFSFVLYENGEVRIRSAKEGGVFLHLVDGQVVGAELALELNDEKIYGLGERYNALNQRGEFVDQFVYNQYKGQGLRTYIPMPLFYTTAGYGMQLKTDYFSWVDCGSQSENILRLGVEADMMEGILVTGSIQEQVRTINQMNGPAEMVPTWALGPWMSSNNWDSEAEVRKQVELTKKHGIPSTVLVIEAWSDEATFYIFNDAVYQEKPQGGILNYDDFTFPEWGRWPDPKGMVAYLHENDLKCILWQIPVIKQITSLQHQQKTMDEAYFIKQGFAVKNPDGSPYRMPEGWFKDSLLMDFSHEKANKWWFDQRQYLIDDLGVDGFKTDGGEFVFGYDLKFADGRTGREMRNAYPNDYVESYYRFAQQNKGITFSRAGYTGAQKFPAHWAGDERSTFGAFRRSLLAGLSAGLSGVIFWGWDLGGFSGEVPTAELFIRSTQMAAFCPIMQYHAESKAELNQDRTPWNIAERSGDERAISVYRYFANLRMTLLPYIEQEAKYAIETGQPLMRPLVLDYEEDLETHEIWDEYLFGRSMLVAPIVEEGARSRSLYLPKGRWFELFREQWFEGETWIDLEVPLEQILVFVKENTVLALNMPESGVLGDPMASNTDQFDNLVDLVIGEKEAEK
jgi:alpha-glucosidase (family GH31 glycosyl hydrolase)